MKPAFAPTIKEYNIVLIVIGQTFVFNPHCEQMLFYIHFIVVSEPLCICSIIAKTTS